MHIICRSYTEFKYFDLSVAPPTIKAGANVTVKVVVANVGSVDGDEVSVCMCVYVCVGNSIMVYCACVDA